MNTRAVLCTYGALLCHVDATDAALILPHFEIDLARAPYTLYPSSSPPLSPNITKVGMTHVVHREGRLYDHQEILEGHTLENRHSSSSIEQFRVLPESPTTVPFVMSAKAINVVAWACV